MTAPKAMRPKTTIVAAIDVMALAAMIAKVMMILVSTGLMSFPSERVGGGTRWMTSVYSHRERRTNYGIGYLSSSPRGRKRPCVFACTCCRGLHEVHDRLGKRLKLMLHITLVQHHHASL